MNFTLKDYQSDAVRDALDNFRKARNYWKRDGDRSAFSLTATTGAGKTVMAAAVFEALFYGDDTYDFEPDPGAVVLWFSDDPSLNEQTRFRLREAADRLDGSDLEVVQNTFNREKFAPGKIYFLNTQKLSKNSLLVRGHEPQQTPLPMDMRPDLRSHTIWDTIQNTIEDPELTLYLVLDEAHRGMGSPSRSTADEKSTIVRTLINGHDSTSAIPIVWGISATVDRFDEAMKESKGRTILPNVGVDASRVQASGLLKDTIVLDIPGEAGAFDNVLVRRGVGKLKEATKAWADYAKEQEEGDTVVPLMVLQVPNTPNPKDIAKSLDVLFSEWPELGIDAVAHVFGDHTTQQFGTYEVSYISPERVQESNWVRVLIAKDAISTGWDCPRAEVMVSFRPAKDRTHITQLLGRMIRTPLARRIPGQDRLNAVDCLLPFFDTKAVTAVADSLMTGESGADELPGRRVLIEPIEMTPNASVDDGVWDKFLSLPSQTLPRKGAKPVKRLTALAQELSSDGLLPDAGKAAHAQLHRVLDAAAARYADEVTAATDDVMTMQGQTLVADLDGKGKTFTQFVEEADTDAIEDVYRRAARAFSPDVARTYAEYLAEKQTDESVDDALLDAHADIAALGLVPQVKTYLEAEAEALANKWFEQYRVSIKGLSDERQDSYAQIKEMSVEPQDVDLIKPENRMEATKVREANGTETPLPVRQHHLLSDESGVFPVDLNGWEIDVLDIEMKRPDFAAWYRNPSRSSQDSLAIAYADGVGFKAVRPDFIVFSKLADGSFGASIVDPHGHHLNDALPKLRGLAEYAERHGSTYVRIDAVAKIGEQMRVLDLKAEGVRKAVLDAPDARSLYESSNADDFV